MDVREVDVAVIGAGTAGMAAFEAARERTDKVLLVEGGPYGTLCAREGCMPSKLLIAAANTAQAVRDAATFGVGTTDLRIDPDAVMARLHRLRDDFVAGVIAEVERLPAEAKLRGTARFTGPTTLEVETDAGPVRVAARAIVVATGSRPTVPDRYADLSRTVTSADVFDWHDLPRSLAVFGGGIIGLELGQALSRLGVRTKLFGKDGLVGPLTDPEVLDTARDLFTDALDFLPHFDEEGVSETNEGVAIAYRAEGSSASATFDHLLVAVGRDPNIASLRLEEAGLALDDAGVPLFDRATCQCGDAPVFIAGDANDEEPLLHAARESGAIAGANAARYPDVAAHARSVPLTVMFCEPQIALAGRTHAELTDSDTAFVTGAVAWTDQGRARILDEAQGRLHLYAAPTDGRILGAEMVGPRSEHLAHLIALAVDRALCVEDLLRLPFYHPTFEEGLKTALQDAAAKVTG